MDKDMAIQCIACSKYNFCLIRLRAMDYGFIKKTRQIDCYWSDIINETNRRLSNEHKTANK